MGETSYVTIESKTFNSDKAITQSVENTRQSIAYLSWVEAHAAGSTVVQVDGQYPSSETISKKQYLLSQELRLFSKIDASDQVQKFLNYCVSQKTGQAIIKDMGWISIG